LLMQKRNSNPNKEIPNEKIHPYLTMA